MKKTMTLAEVKAFFDEERCFETETCFLINRFGKYRPNLTFVVPKVFDLGKDGKPVNPLTYMEDEEVTGNMNLDFDGSPSFIFGDFWRSKKGGACFRPKNPMVAKHLLIRVDWGGAFDRHRGNWDIEGIEGVLYFRHASSNGGGAGYDYWVVPVGFHRSFYDPEFDGETTPTRTAADFETRAKAYRKKHADLMKAKVEEADAFLKEKAVAEEASRKAKGKYLPRLKEIQAELVELSKPKAYGRFGVGELQLEDAYFKLGSKRHLYGDESLEKAEKYLEETKEFLRGRKAAYEARAEFEPKFMALKPRLTAVGWTLYAFDEEVRIDTRGRVHEFAYSEEGLAATTSLLESREAEVAKERAKAEAAARKAAAEAEAKALGLPSNVRIRKRVGSLTGCSKGWVIRPDGTDRERDEMLDKARNYDEGDELWRQILPGELVLKWSKAYTAAPHMFEVIYYPEYITDAQLERVAEIQEALEDEWAGLTGLSSGDPSPSIGQGWGLFRR